MKPLTPIRITSSAAALLALTATAVICSSCRTTEGFGRDLQKVGNKISNAASRAG